jgi:hypothetical protein
MNDQEKIMQKQLQDFMESCPAKSVISAAMGFVFGPVCALFISSFGNRLMV